MIKSKVTVGSVGGIKARGRFLLGLATVRAEGKRAYSCDCRRQPSNSLTGGTADEMKRDLLTVVIFSHERLSQLEVAVESALKANEHCPVLIVDDASQSPEMVKGLTSLERHNRVTVYRRRSCLRRWNQRGGFYPNIRFVLRTVKSPFALLMEDDQQIIRHLDVSELEQITECLGALKSPFMGVTFAHSKDAYLPSDGASREKLFVKTAQAAYSTNAIVHFARLREHRFRIGPSAQATDSAAAAYFGPHPVWPVPILAYRPNDHGFRFGRPIGESQSTAEANDSSYHELSLDDAVRLQSMFPEVPTVTEFLKIRGGIESPQSSSLRGAKGRKSVSRRLWYFLATRTYLITMRARHSLWQSVGNDLTVLASAKVRQTRDSDVA